MINKSVIKIYTIFRVRDIIILSLRDIFFKCKDNIRYLFY